MSEIWWSLNGTDKHCHSHGTGHWVHWIQHKLSVREPGPVIPVTASLDDDGTVILEGDGLFLMGWNHPPTPVRTALRRSGGIALWKPHWHLLVMPTGELVDGASNTFSLAALDDRRECHVTRVLGNFHPFRAVTNPDHLVPREPAPTNVPPLRVVSRYEVGRPKPQRANLFGCRT